VSMDRMVEKAQRLVRSGRVERISHDHFNVVGDHGTYAVVINPGGRLTCNCPGFQSKGRCSHTAAVVYMTQLVERRMRV